MHASREMVSDDLLISVKMRLISFLSEFIRIYRYFRFSRVFELEINSSYFHIGRGFVFCITKRFINIAHLALMETNKPNIAAYLKDKSLYYSLMQDHEYMSADEYINN